MLFQHGSAAAETFTCRASLTPPPDKSAEIINAVGDAAGKIGGLERKNSKPESNH